MIPKYFKTGDIGRINVNTSNSLSIIDRKKQLVKLQNGEYVSLGRVESILCTSQYVELACVIARPTKRGIVALIVPHHTNCKKLFEGSFKGHFSDKSGKLLAALQEELKVKLTTYEMPRAIEIIADQWTPESGMVTGSLKIRRKAIEERYPVQIENLLSSI